MERDLGILISPFLKPSFGRKEKHVRARGRLSRQVWGIKASDCTLLFPSPGQACV